jgi:hypothetical protein
MAVIFILYSSPSIHLSLRVCRWEGARSKLVSTRPNITVILLLTSLNSLSHLVGFALKLRNLGIPDHGLIRELSSPLAGSLYTGEGHSRLYDDEAVY